MERLTHEADFGLEDWEETLFFVKSDPNGAYNILDIAKYQGEPEFDEILKNVALRLAAYENTDLEPETISKIRDIVLDISGNLGRLRELAQADREGRGVVLPCKQDDTVWRICGPKGRKFVAERKVVSVTMYEPGRFAIFTNCDDWLGETVFLTQEEAEANLKERKNNG